MKRGMAQPYADLRFWKSEIFITRRVDREFGKSDVGQISRAICIGAIVSKVAVI